MKPKSLSLLLAGALLLAGFFSEAFAHIGYGDRDFGTLEPNADPVIIANQTVTGNYAWADGTDDNFADSHGVRAFRFSLAEPALVTITFSGSTNGGAADGGIKPGFSVYQGLAHLAPFPPGGSADHDGSAISQAYLATLPGPPKKGVFRSLTDWRIGGDAQTGPVFDFEDPETGLTTFLFKGYAVDGDAGLFGDAPGIFGDGKADGTVTGTFFLPAGDYSIFVGGANYAGQFVVNEDSSVGDKTVYGLTGSVSAVVFSHVVTDPAETGVPYTHHVTLGANQTGGFSDHVGAWSWEDDSLFSEGQPTVGWTHTSNWTALRVQNDTLLTITMSRDANVPLAGGGFADTSSMFPSFTIWRGWQTAGAAAHTYHNRGSVSWAPNLTYFDHIDNSDQESIIRTIFLPKGDYTFALGSNAPATNTNRQGYSITFTTQDQAAADPVPVAGGVGYAHTVNVRADSSGEFSNHVGAWSWEDNDLFNPGEQPVGWTHTSRWLALNVDEDEVLFTISLERDAEVPWPGESDPGRLADTSSMFPSFTLWRGWQNTGGDSHSYHNRGNIAWAPHLRYMDHVDNATQTAITRTYRLPRGQYTFALGSNAPATNPLRQGFKLRYSAVRASSLITGDLSPDGIGYAWTVSVGQGESGSVASHVGAWSWEDEALFDEGQPPVGWTHTSRWLALHVKEPVTLAVTMSRNESVPLAGGGFADTSSMFPSLTLWRGWQSSGGDHHSYNNRGPVAWAPDLQYFDHIDNSSAETITRSWTLQPGQYTFALGSNAPSTNPNRQGFTFAWSASAAQWSPPVITAHPRGATVLAGRSAKLSVKTKGDDVEVQWFKDGHPVQGARGHTLDIASAGEENAGIYTAEARNAAGWLHSLPAVLTVISPPELDPGIALPPGAVGQVYSWSFGASNAGSSLRVTGLPRGLKFNAATNTISGIPAVFGDFTVTLTARNAAGSDALPLTLSIAGLPEGTVATFTGALARAPLLNQQLGGHVQFSITNLGGFSSVVKLGAQTLRKSGRVTYGGAGTTPEVTIDLTRPGQSPVVLTFSLYNGVALGSVSDGLTTLPFEARARAAADEAASFLGAYTLAMLPDAGAVGDNKLPQGHSLGGCIVGKGGAARGSFLLADDSRFTFSAPLEKGGHLTLFSLLYKKTGSLVAVLKMQEADAGGGLHLSEASWFKSAQPDKSKDRLYKQGFGPVALDTIGGLYAAGAGVLATLGLEANPAGNAALEFAHGGVADPATELNVDAVEIPDRPGASAGVVSANPANVALKVQLPAVSAKAKTFAVTQSKVLTTGSFTTAALPGTMKGLMVNDGGAHRLVGYFLLPQAAGKTSEILSGKWDLIQNTK